MKISMSIILTLFFLTHIQAQTIQPDKQAAKRNGKATLQSKNNTKEILSPTQQRAVEIIEQLSQKARDIDDEQARIRVRAHIADVLWDYNSDRSRKIFEEVFEATYSFLIDLQKRNKVSHLDFGSPEHQLHNMVLRLISRRDPDLAEKLVEKAPEIELFRETNRQASLSLQLARDIADTNPERAGQMVGASLKSGINPKIGVILIEIRYKEPTLADKLFLQALTVAQSDPNNISTNINILGAYVFPSYGGFDLELTSKLRGAKEANPITIQRFLEFAYEMIIKRTNETQPIGNPNQQMQGQVAFEYRTFYRLLPYFNQYMPDRVAVLKAHIDYLVRDVPREKIEAITNPFSTDQIDNIIKQANAANSPAERDMLYVKAASFTNLGGNPDKALIITSEIENEQRRSDIESIICFQAALRAISKEEVDTAYIYARRISILPQYAIAFSRILSFLAKTKDKQQAEKNRQRAMDLINEAEQFLLKADNESEKAVAMLTLAEVATKIDSDRAFNFMQYAVKAINSIDFNSNRTPNKGGLERIPIGIDSFGFDQSLAGLARSDPEHSLWLAQSLERKELNILAQLAVCRGMLTKVAGVDKANTKLTEGKMENKSQSQKGSRESQDATTQSKKPF